MLLSSGFHRSSAEPIKTKWAQSGPTGTILGLGWGWRRGPSLVCCGWRGDDAGIMIIFYTLKRHNSNTDGRKRDCIEARAFLAARAMVVCSVETRGIVGASPDPRLNPVLVILTAIGGYLLFPRVTQRQEGGGRDGAALPFAPWSPTAGRHFGAPNQAVTPHLRYPDPEAVGSTRSPCKWRQLICISVKASRPRLHSSRDLQSRSEDTRLKQGLKLC